MAVPSNRDNPPYHNMLYALIIGGSGGSAVFSSGDYHIAAQYSVVLKEGFEVSGTANVTISTMKCQADQKIVYQGFKDVDFIDQDYINDIKKCKTH